MSRSNPAHNNNTSFYRHSWLVLILVCLSGQTAFAQQTGRPETGNFGRLTMIADDGSRQACELRMLKVKVAVAGTMARTEVEQVFYNPIDSDMEGTFEFELPPSAAVNRLALEIDGKLVEGEIVERQRARLVYEKIVRSMRDPALLEWQSGDRFKTQVYPVPARGLKRIVLAYLTRLPERNGQLEYRYKLPQIAEGEKPIANFAFDMKLREPGGQTVTPYDATVTKNTVHFKKEGFKPRGDLLVRIPRTEPGSEPIASLTTAGKRRVFSLELAPKWSSRIRQLPRDIIILVDSSASLRGEGFEQIKQTVAQIIKSLKPDDRIRVVAGDVKLWPLRNGFLKSSQATKVSAFIDKLEPAGATNLEQLLLAGAVRPGQGRRSVAIYLGDGQASLGELDGDLISASVIKTYRKNRAELNAVGLGDNPSTDFLHKLTRSCLGRTITKEPGRALNLTTFLKLLNEPLLTDIALSFKNECAEQILPNPLPNLARSERLEIMGLLKSKRKCQVKLSGNLSGQRFTFTTKIDPAKATHSDLLGVFWARDRIAYLERVAGDRKEIISLSQEFGIMCRYTSWLVLENDQAYKHHKIKRNQPERQAAQKDLPDKSKGPLKKAKLGKGQSVSDFLKSYQESEGSSGEDRNGESNKKEMDLADESPPMPMTAIQARPMKQSVSRRGSKLSKRSKHEKPISVEQSIKQLNKSIKSNPNHPYFRQQLIALLVSSGKKKQAHQKIIQWLDMYRLDPDKLIQLVAPAIDSLPNDKWCQKQRIELYKLALEARPDSISFIDGFIYALVRADKSKDAFEFLEKQRLKAKQDTDRLLAIIPAYGRLSSMPAARKALLELSSTLLRERPLDSNLRRMHLDQLKVAGLKKEALNAIVDWRRYAPDHPDLVIEHVDMLRNQHMIDKAERVLSELVEFNPHDYAARSTYARQLSQKRVFAKFGQPTEACEQYTRAVQLNPSKRDTFKTMMALRRDHPKAAKQIGRCIVDGVSRLPIIRDVSIVMLWEDPSADIDMHVIEPGGEEVDYQHLESAQGGHLYYDVTDGFGPEIYVLGSGKAGTYRLKVVYYSGSAPVVRGKMIVMRHAGGPEETRRVYPFELKGSNSSKSIPVGSFKISR